ncbi:MAG: DUF5309 family protein [Candidatus Dojkabacteria bacterium]
MSGVAKFVNPGAVDTEGVYKFSFGDTPHETMYSGPLEAGQDCFPEMPEVIKTWQERTFGTVQKASNVGAASGSAGYVPMPLAYDSGVIDITRRFTPIKALIPKVTNLGLTANYFRITAREDGTWGKEDPALEEADDTSKLESEVIRYCRITGRVTGVAQSGGAHFANTMRREMMNKTQSLNETIEDTLLNGNNNTNPYQPNGLRVLVGTDSAANTENLSGADPTMEDIDDMVNKCFIDKGAPNLLITDPFTASKLKRQIMQTVRYTDPYTTVAWGLKALSVNTVVGEIPLIVSQFMPTTASAREILVLNTRFLEQRVLQDITFERLAKTSDSEKFMLKVYMTLINTFPEGMGKIYGCA